MANKYFHPQADFWRKYELPEPEAIPHGTPDDISSEMKKLMPTSWRLEGDRLIGKTEMGELVQKIPSDYILTQTDSNGLPVFRKIQL